MESRNSRHIAALDGLRFIAALCVIAAHYAQWLVHGEGSRRIVESLSPFSGFGMALFFCLSGFVIHYNYHEALKAKGGPKRFFVARITRLYPLFILLVVIDIFLSLLKGYHACGQVEGQQIEWLYALPLYLTMTQSWFFDIWCGHSIIYQFGQVSAISWSISVEFFLYLAYLIFSKPLAKLGVRGKLILAVIFHVCIMLLLRQILHSAEGIEGWALERFGEAATQQNGYQDSLLRWLYYFNPIAQMSGFIGGMAAAELYMARGAKNGGNGWAIASILLAVAVHYLCYYIYAPTYGFIGRTASTQYMPLIVLMIYAFVRFPQSLPSRMVSNSLFTKLGEASYSIYLLHGLLILGWWKLAHFIPEWPLYVVAIAGVLVAARISYLRFERPVMRYLRQKLN